MRPFLLPYLKLSVCGNVNAESPIDQSQNFLSTWLFICTKNYKTQYICLLYTSDAADDMQCVDLGGRRIIKKK